MSISAADVMKLRKATGAGMMDCKSALAEANGDFERATEIIREKGKLVASKRADREATEGVVLAKVSADKKSGGLVVLNCETDFVAKNEGFIAFAGKILNHAIAEKAADLDAVKAISLDGRTVEAQVLEQTGVIGEKLDLPFYASLQAETVVAYIHPGNRLATLVGFNKAGVDEQITKDVAMQVAAMSPVAVDKASVPAEVVAKELEIAKEKFRLEGKPEAMLDKIAQGALEKFFKESTLLNQAFIKESKQTVADYLKSHDKDLTVTAFVRYALSE
ncbi:MAG: translation elongation factor Ts [Bacteroidetes bacterium GWF2_42_66]|nr:MAG: translation elongation factor Ts [Bacteroidetes bacterium GWA2_42_15]OFX97118.1 MAG: translation elongation factor Ts [Bacteroidetes bacterium GWE2_42_39]OFY46189.1 MAG: translation elongation factor Ts [Bacteroidetes bacterium GWF2_42_66]HBL78045.1 elongation factor Ts [Prolixibacteraceae bacterium]HCR92055.1 elongation factor Ts [Prolixibacteraceae bacterium]